MSAFYQYTPNSDADMFNNDPLDSPEYTSIEGKNQDLPGVPASQNFYNQYAFDNASGSNKIFPLARFHTHLIFYDIKGNWIYDVMNDNFSSGPLATPTYNCAMEIDYQTSNQSTPSSTNITLHNLTNKNYNLIQKGGKVKCIAGWRDPSWTHNNYEELFSETIKYVEAMQDDSGDWQVSITCQDGDKFANEQPLSKLYKNTNPRAATSSSGVNAIKAPFIKEKKQYPRNTKADKAAKQQISAREATAVAAFKQKQKKLKQQQVKAKQQKQKQSANGMHFKAGTTGKQIIQALAKQAHIHISYLDLVDDHNKFPNGYTASKSAWQCIQDVADDCNSNIWWPHGKLYIGNFANQKPIPFILDSNTGLIEPPTQDDSDEDPDDDTDDNSNANETDDTTKPKKGKGKNTKQQIPKPFTPRQYDLTSVYLPFMTVGTTFHLTDPAQDLIGLSRDAQNENQKNYVMDGDINSKYALDATNNEAIPKGSIFNDEVVVINCEDTIEDSSMPSSQLTVERVSDVKKQQAIKVKTKNIKAEEARKAKAAKAHKEDNKGIVGTKQKRVFRAVKYLTKHPKKAKSF